MAGNRELFQKAMNEGNSVAWDQDWAKAEGYYADALNEFPDHPLALMSMGLALFEQKRLTDALEYYKKASIANPNDPAAPEKIADIFGRQGRLKEAVQAFIHAAELNLQNRDAERAIECYIQVTSLQPDNLHAHTRLALIYERMKKTDLAIEEFLAAASVLQRTGRVNKAAQTIDHCLKIEPDHVGALEAKRLLETNQMLPQPTAPKDVEASLRMAEVTAPRKDPITQEVIKQENTVPIEYVRQKSLIRLASLLFDSPENFAFDQTGMGTRLSNSEKDGIMRALNLAVDAMTHNQPEEALEQLENLIRAGLAEPAVYYNIGYLSADSNQRRAVEALEHCVRKDDFALGAFLLLGEIYAKRGGLAGLRRAASAYMRSFCIADLLTVEEEHRDSLRKYYTAIIDAPQHENDEEKLRDICSIVSELLNREKWLPYIKSVRARLPISDPKNPMPLSDFLLKSSSSKIMEAITYIQKLTQEGKYDSAMEEAFYALKFTPNYLPLHLEIGELLVLKDDLMKAVEKFAMVSRLYLLRGEIQQGINTLRHAVELSPYNYKLRNELIEHLIEQNQVEEALEQYLILAKNYETLLNFDEMRKVYFDALRLAARAEASRDWSLRVLYLIADVDMQRLDWHRAIRVYEQIRTLDPNDGKARAELIGLHFRLGKDAAAADELNNYVSGLRHKGLYDEAIAFIRALKEEWPQKLVLRRGLAEFYARIKQNKKAVEELNSIAELLLDEGKFSETVDILQRMITLDPEKADEYQKAILKLKQSP
ncbi:MAG: tetratricopeptide repeat protein [Anaerolineaceae bacterium]|nr:tetratricopeptide repeat protein [Anaerolineaceae bacterium]